MDFVKGIDLGRRLQRRGRLDENDARGIFAQTAEALRHSHALGVIHRDIKPGNVLLAAPIAPGGQECVKLVDFGLSKDLTGSACSGFSTPFLGTKHYRAPESQQRPTPAIRHADPDDVAKVDVFALGVTLFAMLSGQHPPDKTEVSEQELSGPLWNRISKDAKILLIGLLRHDPKERLGLDDVIEHAWLNTLWRGFVDAPPSEVTDRVSASAGENPSRRFVDPDASAAGLFRDLPPPRPEPENNTDILTAPSGRTMDVQYGPRPRPSTIQGPRFASAFPEAVALSCAAKIPATTGLAPGGAPRASEPPGWGVVLSWMAAERAAAAAQEVLCKAGMATSSGRSGFGRAPLVRPTPSPRGIGNMVGR